VIIECRRYTTSRVSQEEVAAVAYRMRVTGAKSAIIVTPFELQKGAKNVAATEGITHVKLAADSTTADYVCEFLEQVFTGISATVMLRGSLSVLIVRVPCNAGQHAACPGECDCECHGLPIPRLLG
jgi:hypothetical protein